MLSHIYLHDIYGAPFHMFGQYNGLVIEYSYITRSQSTAEEHSGIINFQICSDKQQWET